MNFPGMMGGGAPSADAMQQAQQNKLMEMQMKMLMESCPTKCALAGVMGFGLGGMFGLFMSSFDYQSAQYALDNVPMKEQVKQGFRDMGKKSWGNRKELCCRWCRLFRY